jgi:signal transduction histidine kinase
VPHAIPERALHQVERIRVSARALLHLVEEVLSFSRIEAGKEDIRISPVELKALIGECLALVEPMALHKQLEVRLSLPDEPVKIVSDERKIRQILTNLLSNAVKFTEQGMVSVKLRRRGGEVHIVVADTGIGISQEHLERIFDPFWQVEPATTRRFGGTGLGLGVARKLARLLEGRLDVRSVEGKGSTFLLALPVRLQQMSRTTS